MSLINLKTRFKDLRFGSDQPGNGSSGLPYIQTRIPDNAITFPGNTNPIYKTELAGPLDFPIRGGAADFKIGTQTFTISSKIDKERIKKFMQDPARGKAFIDKQVGLQLTNPKIETGGSFQVGARNPLPGIIANTRIYNKGKNTLEQVGFAGSGLHVPRAGLGPFDYGAKYYYDIVRAQSLLTGQEVQDTNRLLILAKLKLSTNPRSQIVNINQVNSLGISLNRDTLFNYLGGPGSVYGIGATVINRVDDTSKAFKVGGGIAGALSYEDIMAKQFEEPRINGKNLRENEYNLTGIKKFGSTEDTRDLLNSLRPFAFQNDDEPWDNTKYGKDTKDIIKFVFEAIENDNKSTSYALFFRAYLSGFTDNHQASITSFKYIGRGEDFFTYQGVSRAISFSFKIAVGSEQEQQPLYTKLNQLISQVYPDYSSTYGVMRAPVIRLTIGDYLYRVAGMLESVNITVDDNVSWEIASTYSLKQLPHVINVQCSFKPIQDFLPRRVTDKNPNVPYITNSTKDYVKIDEDPVQLRKRQEEARRAELIESLTRNIRPRSPIEFNPLLRNSIDL
jgi:hypothetical protein